MMHATRRDALESIIAILSIYLFFWSLMFFINHKEFDPLISAAALTVEAFVAIYFFPAKKKSKWEF